MWNFVFLLEIYEIYLVTLAHYFLLNATDRKTTFMTKITAAITAVGKYLPDHVLTNEMLSQMVETNDEWITTRTGIKERRILKEEGAGTSYMAIRAAQDLLRKRNIDPKEIDLVLMARATPDMMVASTGTYVATEIGAVNAFAYDLQAACSSFLYGMSAAAACIESGRYKKVLLMRRIKCPL